MKKSYKIMIVAGEASGDAHGAKLVNALRELQPNIEFEFFGASGLKLREAGVEAVVKSDQLSITGLPEILRAFPMFWKTFQILKSAAKKRKPDLVILIDFPEFNLKLAKTLKKQGLKVVYYISPQIWAWRKYRIKTFKKYVDLLLTILPFEKDWYKKFGVLHVEYVGNPLVREVHSDLSKLEFCTKHSIDPTRPIISLLPGSRNREISKILPVLVETASLMSEKVENLQFVIAQGQSRKDSEIKSAIKKAKTKVNSKNLFVVKGEAYDALNASDASAVASGTATLEATIIGTPFAIVYKTSPFNYKLMRPLITTAHFGLVNLIANERVVNEFIQEDFTKESLSAELFRLLGNDVNRKMRRKLKLVTDKLGHGGASKRAAEAIFREIGK